MNKDELNNNQFKSHKKPESKKFFDNKKQLKYQKEKAKKQPMQLSKRFKVAAIAILLSLGINATRQHLINDYQTQKIYAQEIKNKKINKNLINDILTKSKSISEDIQSNKIEKTHKKLLDDTKELKEKLNIYNIEEYQKYFNTSGENTLNTQITTIHIHQNEKNPIDPKREKVDSYYLKCGNHYLLANGIYSVELVAKLNDLYNKNKTFDQENHDEMQQELQNITKNLSKEKLETKTIFKNDGKPLSLTETQAKQKLEKLEKNPFKKILTPSQEKQQNLINKRQEIIRNTAKVTTTHINKIQYNQKIDKNKDLNGKTIKNKDNDIEER